MLTFRLEPTSGRGTVLIHMADGSRAFETRLRFDGPRIECSAVDTQSPLGERPTIRRAAPASSAIRLVEATLVDQQFLLAVDGRLMMVWPYERAKASEPPSCHLAIGAEGDSVAIRELRVYRDTYYTQPVAPPGRRPVDQPLLLGEGEYFVLGDNSSASDDSRTWPEPGTVDAKSLIGKPLVAVPSFSVSAWGSRCFHVPNLLQMRYIR
jgi:signal peptidase I